MTTIEVFVFYYFAPFANFPLFNDENHNTPHFRYTILIILHHIDKFLLS
ncbi:hypothetical protein GAGA_4626 [Paraglaciecola agarilytica NO2]|uniref:Uncharacterized protein n=1 Tax=Paraglaciecola agarilytica NO2 TaxID=1125747 RepID=A0ABQ0IDT0_9ALTE|nr:hypothetical protein GAGA_4626 [Paraglaciecola agarilytica NO2]